MIKRDLIVALLTLAVVALTGAATLTTPAPQGSQTPVSTSTVTTGIPVVLNGSLPSNSVTTLISGTGTGWLVYTLTNEETNNGIRCMYGSTMGDPPATAPTAVRGNLIGPMVTLTERTAPSNRLDCIATSGTVTYDLTLYPK
jgi:hypothetical protein